MLTHLKKEPTIFANKFSKLKKTGKTIYNFGFLFQIQFYLQNRKNNIVIGINKNENACKA